jgi:hypothetical protein
MCHSDEICPIQSLDRSLIFPLLVVPFIIHTEVPQPFLPETEVRSVVLTCHSRLPAPLTVTYFSLTSKYTKYLIVGVHFNFIPTHPSPIE